MKLKRPAIKIHIQTCIFLLIFLVACSHFVCGQENYGTIHIQVSAYIDGDSISIAEIQHHRGIFAYSDPDIGCKSFRNVNFTVYLYRNDKLIGATNNTNNKFSKSTYQLFKVAQVGDYIEIANLQSLEDKRLKFKTMVLYFI